MEDDSTLTTTSLEGLKIDSCSKLVLSEEILNFQRENSIPASLLENLYVLNKIFSLIHINFWNILFLLLQ